MYMCLDLIYDVFIIENIFSKAGFILGRFLNDFGDQNDFWTILVGAPIFGRFLNVFWSCVYL